MLMILAACASCAALLWAAFLVCGLGRRPAIAAVSDVDGSPAEPNAGASPAAREEDRIRPAVDRSGAPIWIGAEDLFWHDIVCWPPRSSVVDDLDLGLAARRSSARG
jgi:hypothetical protein